jgi:hypothetical protein
MSARTIYRDATEYLTVSVTADVSLTTQPVYISVDNRATWLTATWIGTAGTTRSCQVLLNNTNMPVAGDRQLFVKITDSPETPIIPAAGACNFI